MFRIFTFIHLQLLSIVFLLGEVSAQTVFSRFDFNTVPITVATIGPAGVSADPNSTSDGSNALITANCAPTKGLNLVTNNSGGLYDQGSMGMSFRFKRLEAYASFFLRGGTEFYIQGGVLRLDYRTHNGAGGFTHYGPISIGYALPNDNAFHVYTFEYHAPTGVAGVSVDGVVIWSSDGPNDRPLYWVGDPAPVIGIIMDGNCTGPGFLDYALFYVPPVPLAVEFVAFDALQEAGDVALRWSAARASAQNDFVIERSTEAGGFQEVGRVPSMDFVGVRTFEWTDVRPGPGLWFYRVRQVDDEGVESISDTRSVLLTEGTGMEMRVWPNPAQEELQVQVGDYLQGGELTLENLSGVVVRRGALRDGRAELPLDGLPAGMYYVHYRAQGQHLIEKLRLQ
jgi:hypothetical protein